MSCREALEAAGAKVAEFEEFGSYQGEWWALVEFEGRIGWINGSYGSCPGCDAFQAEFGWNDEPWCDEHSYDAKDDCADCAKAKAAYATKVAAFGRGYLDNIRTQAEAEAKAGEYADWDCEADAMVAFIRRHAEGVS